MYKPVLLLVALLLGGCATYGPTWSEISGNRYYNRALADRQPALILDVDGTSYTRSTRYPIKLDPGPHEIMLEGVSRHWSGTPEKKLRITLEPCQRYYLNAQFDNRIMTNWTPVVDYVEPIAGCFVAAGTPRAPAG